MAKVTVVHPEDGEIERKVLAQAIIDVSKDLRKLYESGLNKKAVIALLKDSTGFNKSVIQVILDSLVDLKAMYCR